MNQGKNTFVVKLLSPVYDPVDQHQRNGRPIEQQSDNAGVIYLQVEHADREC